MLSLVPPKRCWPNCTGPTPGEDCALKAVTDSNVCVNLREGDRLRSRPCSSKTDLGGREGEFLFSHMDDQGQRS